MLSDENQNILISITLATIILIGLFGNLMNIIVFSVKTMRKNSTFKYLFYLSIIDVLVLLICSTDSLLTHAHFIMIRLKSNLVCKIDTFLTYFFTHMSSIILMVVNLNRVLVIKSQKSKNKQENTPIDNKQRISISLISSPTFQLVKVEKVNYVIILLCLILVFCNSHYLIFMDLNRIEMFKKLEKPKTFNYSSIFYKKMKSMLNESLTFYNNSEIKLNDKELIPDLDLGSKSQRNSILRYYQRLNSSININMCYPNVNSHYHFFLSRIWIWIDMIIFSLLPFTVMIICSILIIHEIFSKSKDFLQSKDKNNAKILEKSKQRNRKLLIMLTVTNLYFVSCSLPLCINIILDKINNIKEDGNLLLTIFQIISYSNNAFNFVFYLIFSESYRKVLSSIIFSWKPKKETNKLAKLYYSKRLNHHNIINQRNVSDPRNLVLPNNQIAINQKSTSVRFNLENISALERIEFV